MAGLLFKAVKSVALFAYGLFILFVYAVLQIWNGNFFKRPTEREKLELQLARDRFWNLSNEWSGLSHQFVTLRSGFTFHYVCNDKPGTDSNKPLVIFVHGFPDSWAVWRYVINSAAIQDAATTVAVDLPGYGGSDSLEEYNATNVLENLADFVVRIRAMYGIDSDAEDRQRKTVIVGHDWGCLLSMRLAAEAPQLADRFILTNGPVPALVASNVRRQVSSSLKMFKTALRSPLASRSTMLKAVKSLKPVLLQVARSGYIAAFQLPMPFVRCLGSGGNYVFLRVTHRVSHGKAEFSVRDAAECMASTRGPSVEECKTKTADGVEYPASVKTQRVFGNFDHMVGYYRDGAAVSRWQKSIETIASLHSIARGGELRRTSVGAGLFDDGPQGALKGYATVIWGKEDIALDPQLCLDGISDYLVRNSQVVMLPRSGHFTPIERESRVALEKAVEWTVKGEREDIGAVARACYPKATVTVRK